MSGSGITSLVKASHFVADQLYSMLGWLVCLGVEIIDHVGESNRHTRASQIATEPNSNQTRSTAITFTIVRLSSQAQIKFFSRLRQAISESTSSTIGLGFSINKSMCGGGEMNHGMR